MWSNLRLVQHLGSCGPMFWYVWKWVSCGGSACFVGGQWDSCALLSTLGCLKRWGTPGQSPNGPPLHCIQWPAHMQQQWPCLAHMSGVVSAAFGACTGVARAGVGLAAELQWSKWIGSISAPWGPPLPTLCTMFHQCSHAAYFNASPGIRLFLSASPTPPQWGGAGVCVCVCACLPFSKWWIPPSDGTF